MKLKDILFMILLAAVWGFNFVPIRIGLNHVPPLTFTALRFLFTVFPVIFFVRKPNLSFAKMAIYGAVMFAAQFGFSFSAIYQGLSPGLTSLVMQTQAFFTIGLAALLLRERPLPFQIIGALVAACGILIVGWHIGGDVTILGLLCALAAAFSWSCGNLMTKSFGKIDMLGVIVWGNLMAFFAIAPAAYFVEGRDAIIRSVTDMQWQTVFALLYVSYGAMYVGYSIWNYMLSRHPAAVVVPFTLLVPAFAMASASFVLGEPYPMWKFEATIMILCGLALNQFGGKAVALLVRSGVTTLPD